MVLEGESIGKASMSHFDDLEIFRGILESLPIGLCVLDKERNVLIWSDGAERATGRLRHEVVGRSCISNPLLHCDQPGCEFCKEDCPAARAIKNSALTESPGFLRHKSGHELPVRIRAVPVHNAHGSIIGAVETFEEQQATHGENHEGSVRSDCVDDVTGLPSQILMRSHIHESLERLADLQLPFSVLIFQLEGMEHFRGSFGSEAASSLLRVTARTLEGSIFKTDFAGRWSSDQFLLILNGCREESLYSVRERIRRMLALECIEWWGERRSLPVLVGQAAPQPGDTPETLISRAQQSLAVSLNSRSRAASAGPGLTLGS
jgi:diguanylate cyclase (GGDEF)-like protein/PAS domain S-box-containing protein